MLDPDGHRVEFYYGMEQIGWDRRSKPGAAYVQAVRNGFTLPQPSEMTEIMQAEGNGVDLDSGFRPAEELPCDYCVGGVMLPRPFKVTKIGPVNLFVADIDASERFYTELLGLTKTEDVQYQRAPVRLPALRHRSPYGRVVPGRAARANSGSIPRPR